MAPARWPHRGHRGRRPGSVPGRAEAARWSPVWSPVWSADRWSTGSAYSSSRVSATPSRRCGPSSPVHPASSRRAQHHRRHARHPHRAVSRPLDPGRPVPPQRDLSAACRRIPHVALCHSADRSAGSEAEPALGHQVAHDGEHPSPATGRRRPRAGTPARPAPDPASARRRTRPPAPPRRCRPAAPGALPAGGAARSAPGPRRRARRRSPAPRRRPAPAAQPAAPRRRAPRARRPGGPRRRRAARPAARSRTASPRSARPARPGRYAAATASRDRRPRCAGRRTTPASCRRPRAHPAVPASPASASHSSTYSAGSSSSRCSTQASQPVPATHPAMRDSHGCPETCAQLASTWHQPPSASTAGAPVTIRRTISSPGSPESRYTSRSPAADDITNGGLVTTRSNRSPATGSYRSPARSSYATCDSSAVSRAIASARSLTSVATTSPACAARCSDCTPQPVPRSSARPTGSRTASCASVVEAGLIPSTWSVPTRRLPPSSPGVRSHTTHQSAVPSPYGRTSARARTSSPERASRPAAASGSTQTGQRPLRMGQRHCRLQRPQSRQRGQRHCRRRAARAAPGRWSRAAAPGAPRHPAAR